MKSESAMTRRRSVEPVSFTPHFVWAKMRLARRAIVARTFGSVSTSASAPPAMNGLVAILWMTCLPKK